MKVCGKEISIRGRLVRIARVAAEGFEFVEDPPAMLKAVGDCGTRIDLFTFMQRLPYLSPLYDYPMEWDNVAGLPISTFDHWWNKQIDGKTRNMVRRAEKKGLTVRETPFDDSLVHGIWRIYNECPIRQGRHFPHYGKDLEAVRRMSATFLEDSVFIGAYRDEQLIGFMKLTSDSARSQAAVMHILSMVEHQDKAPANALIAQAVRSCAQRQLPFLVYSSYTYGNKQRDSLTNSKDNNGFQRLDLPRYYVPLTSLGHLAFRLGGHHSLQDQVPEGILSRFRDLRSAWYRHRLQTHSAAH